MRQKRQYVRNEESPTNRSGGGEFLGIEDKQSLWVHVGLVI
jgi:hypothetical protein